VRALVDVLQVYSRGGDMRRSAGPSETFCSLGGLLGQKRASWKQLRNLFGDPRASSRWTARNSTLS